jgi:hypothetical protein
VLIEARRYRRALVAYLRCGGTRTQIRAATNCSRPDVERLLHGQCGLLTAAKAKRIEGLLSRKARAWVRESPRYRVSVGQIPTQLVSSMIEQSLRRHGQAATEQMTGIMARQFYGVVWERTGIRFEHADRIVTRLAGPEWWFETNERRRWLWSDTVFGGQSAPRRRSNRKAGARHRAKAAV